MSIKQHTSRGVLGGRVVPAALGSWLAELLPTVHCTY
jgi:hypothetical protein